ncbi:chemotaxis protein CheB [Cohnella hashimotonis]|uniref:Protein-glutamate methylesterase/protein-glutamine glutaminase n=1 Tax=Cohnella hashimotonis TaxID=2826895 RepID=A0ABT6THY5_9BACL|nr:chemotaxis protein CheB [Cohnella hashimotonis]MDI4646201.1 chemotaxis protein CheB [Cohnella hashimotonis]
MKAFKVLVVDDSPFMRKLVGDLVAGDVAFEVVGTAADGAEAVRQVRELRPDIAVMDLEMPEINGLEALKRIMSECPTPVIMMSAVTDRGTRDTIRALQYGAFDFVRKPDGALKLDVSHMGEMLIEKLHIARELLASGELRLRRMTEEGAEAMVFQAEATAEAKAAPSTEMKEEYGQFDAAEAAVEAGAYVEAEAKFEAALEVEADDAPPSSNEAQASEHAPPRTPDRESPKLRSELTGLSSKARLSNMAPANKEAAAAIERPAAQDTSAHGLPPARRTVPKAPLPAGEQKDRNDRPSGKTELTGKQTADQGLAAPKPSKTAKAPPSAPPPQLPKADKQPKRIPLQPVARPADSFTDIVAIGTSTGGPRALHEVLSAIPASFPAPILIVQHMPPKFTHSLAQRLDSCSAIEVREAADGDRVLPGQAYLAPGGKHLKLIREASGGYKIGLTEEDPVSGHRPSVDVMFGSLVGRRELRRHAVLMTGMGSDGAKAMKTLREDGAATLIAEAEETCVVYGMPRSAMENGAAQTAVPLQRIAPELVKAVEKPNAKQL